MPTYQPATGEPTPPLSDPLLYATAPETAEGPVVEPGTAPSTDGLITKVKDALS